MSDEFFWDGYLHWARVIEKLRRDSAAVAPGIDTTIPPELYEPLFIRLKASPAPDVVKDLLMTIDGEEDRATILQKIREIGEFALLDDYVLCLEDFLIGLENFLTEGGKSPPEFFIYRPLVHENAAQALDEAKFDVIDIGAPAFVAAQDAPHAAPRMEVTGPKVIGALIDNDIGFLNRRFRKRDETATRFAAIWLQARERLIRTQTAPATAERSMLVGRILSHADIDKMLADARLDERAAYLEINRDLHLYEPFRRFPPIDAHGSAVADLAFGAEPGAMDDVPLLAVQLPPEAAVDTSGTYSESYIVQGFRWLCWQARRIEARATLIVNISYGAIAGQKDGGKFIEAQIRREIELAALQGQQVHVVYAFGNSGNSRQIARIKLAPGASSPVLTWCIAPDDPVPSFAEIRAVRQNADGREQLVAPPAQLCVALGQPDGGTTRAQAVCAGDAVPPLANAFDAAVARVYRVCARKTSGRAEQSEYLLAAIAPSRQLSADIPRAPAGDWKLALVNDGETDLDIVVQIQRGDTAPGFGIGGRQSCFEGEYVSALNGEFIRRDVEPPLTNDGTQSAYTTASLDARIHTAGALRALYEAAQATDYSPRGACWTAVRAPTHQVVVDRLTTRGHATAGAYSGSRTRLSGSSAAAALVSNGLLQARRNGPLT